MIEPIPMRIHCPACCALHIDEGKFATKPHHTHACQECGMVWRPAVEPTVGVRFLPGFKNGSSAGSTSGTFAIARDTEQGREWLDRGGWLPRIWHGETLWESERVASEEAALHPGARVVRLAEVPRKAKP